MKLSLFSVPYGKEPASILDEMAQRVRGVYLHLELDIIDPVHGRANSYATPGGISPGELRQAGDALMRRIPIRAVGLASYDPAVDASGSIRKLAIDIITSAIPDAAGTGVSSRV